MKRKRNYGLRHRKVAVGIYDDYDNGFWAGRGGASQAGLFNRLHFCNYRR